VAPPPRVGFTRDYNAVLPLMGTTVQAVPLTALAGVEVLA
jgi:hypothetical protein